MKYQYQIWQLKENFVRELGFRSYDKVEDNFFKENYSEVYQGDLEVKSGERIYEVLEDLFRIFNVHRPADFKGHSLSVSDVVVVNGRAFYCDKVGWVEVDFEEVSMDSIYADEELAEVEKQYNKIFKEEE